MNLLPRSEFPRPDFVRQRWQCLNGDWQFSFAEPTFDRKITVPYCYQSALSGIAEKSDHPCVWYRRNFDVDAGWSADGRLLLKFGAVDTRADVWLNGQYLGCHVGGYTPFSFDITKDVKPQHNELVVKAQDSVAADKPRGKQTWRGELFGCWYTPISGIWQSVWLEQVGSIYAERIKLTPNADRLTALCEVFVAEEATVRAEVTACLRGEELCQQTFLCENGYGKTCLAFPDMDVLRHQLLWSPENPNLIDVRVVLTPTTGAADIVDTYFGLRSIECRNGQVLLNGEPYYQRLVLDQGYWPDSLLTPPTDDAIRQDLELTKAMGFNGARKHQKIEDPRYYYWADRLGVLVWGELPSAYLFNDKAIESSSQTLHEFVQRDFNHPCIVMWVPVNESWGVRDVLNDAQQQNYCRMLTYQLKALDPTRPVSSNDGWEQVSETDICAIHDYGLMPETLESYTNLTQVLHTMAEHRLLFAKGNAYGEQPILLTEYGGIAFVQDGDENSWGYYGRVANAEEFLARLSPTTNFLLQSRQFAGFCYTQLTDVMQEVNGLLYEDRSPKLPLTALAAVFGKRRR